MINLVKSCIILCILLFVPVFLSAQTAAELENMLEIPAVTCSQAARFVCASSEAAEGVSLDNAFVWAVDKGWISKKAAAEDPINLGTLSFLLMKAFNVRGGMMYALFPGPRYAFRTMVNRSWIQNPADPGLQVSGERFLLILGNVLNAAGGE